MNIFCSHCGAGNGQETVLCFACGSSVLAGPYLDRDEMVGTGQGKMLQQRYLLLEKVGEGGFSTVYKAEDRQTGDIVAIKAISLQGLTALEKIEATDAFNREVQMLSRLEHKHLPSLHDHFSDSDCWYMVMDFIAGTTLEKRLERRKGTPLPIEEVFDIGLILCHVLGYLHHQRPPIIFRDLKPTNIILTRTGHLFLIDFGIARHYRPGQTRDTMPFGSPGYAAPEQYGKAQTTPLADIYSLGAILHQLLSGDDPAQNPFRFAPLDNQYQPDRAALNALIQRMVQTDPERRPGDITLVKRELQAIATQRTFQRGLYSSKPTVSYPYTPHTLYMPQYLQSGQTTSIWSTGGQLAMTSATMAGQIRQTQSYPYTANQRLRAQKRQASMRGHINSYALSSLFSGLAGIFLSLFLSSIVTRNIEIHDTFLHIAIPAILLLLPFVLSIILGHMGKRRARTQVNKRASIHLANAGIFLGYTFCIIYFIFLLWMFFSTARPG